MLFSRNTFCHDLSGAFWVVLPVVFLKGPFSFLSQVSAVGWPSFFRKRKEKGRSLSFYLSHTLLRTLSYLVSAVPLFSDEIDITMDEVAFRDRKLRLQSPHFVLAMRQCPFSKPVLHLWDKIKLYLLKRAFIRKMSWRKMLILLVCPYLSLNWS